MNISILISSVDHPFYPDVQVWAESKTRLHTTKIVNKAADLFGGDLLLLISCNEIVPLDIRRLFKKALVVHASDLPNGRGWSPHIWGILGGASQITISLLEAQDEIDSGDILQTIKITVPCNLISREINALLFTAEIELMDFAVENFDNLLPTKQAYLPNATIWPKRTPNDSEIDANASISEQFNLLRVCDSERFPAFFYKDGRKFILILEVVDE